MIAEYLHRLGFDGGVWPPPTLETLLAVQEAHVRSVPYENVWSMLGRPPSVDPSEVVDRIVSSGRAGYCFHLNGALEALLGGLGFHVTRHHGQVWDAPGEAEDVNLNHLILQVHDLPTDANPSGSWWVDAGFGDGPVHPLPLTECEVRQGDWTYELRRRADGGWSFRHDPAGAFTGCELRDLPVDEGAVAAAHRRLTDTDGAGFRRMVIVQRRDRRGCSMVVGAVRRRVEPGSRDEEDLDGMEEWVSVIGTCGLSLAELSSDELDALWRLTQERHERWVEAGRPGGSS